MCVICMNDFCRFFFLFEILLSYSIQHIFINCENSPQEGRKILKWLFGFLDFVSLTVFSHSISCYLRTKISYYLRLNKRKETNDCNKPRCETKVNKRRAVEKISKDTIKQKKIKIIQKSYSISIYTWKNINGDKTAPYVKERKVNKICIARSIYRIS